MDQFKGNFTAFKVFYNDPFVFFGIFVMLKEVFNFRNGVFGKICIMVNIIKIGIYFGAWDD